MHSNNSAPQTDSLDACSELDLEVAEVYVSFLLRRAVKDKSLLDDRGLRVQDAVDAWNRGIAEAPDKPQLGSKRARFEESPAARAGESEPEESARSQPTDTIATSQRKTNSKINNRQIDADAQHSRDSLGNQHARHSPEELATRAVDDPGQQRASKHGRQPTPPRRAQPSSKHQSETPAEERSDARDASRAGEEEEDLGSATSERRKPQQWSYMNSYSDYSLKDHPYIAKKKLKLQKQLEHSRKAREEARKRTDFFQPFEFEEALKQQSRQESLFATSIANVDRKLEEFHQKKKNRELLGRDEALPPALHLRAKKEPVVPQKEAADWVRELARDQRLREERKRQREEARVKKVLEEEQARQQQKAEEARRQKQVRLARVQGHLEEMAQKREVFQQVTRFQNKIVKDLVSRPQVFYYVRPSEEALQRLRQKLLPSRLRLADPQPEQRGSRRSDSELEVPADYERN